MIEMFAKFCVCIIYHQFYYYVLHPLCHRHLCRRLLSAAHHLREAPPSLLDNLTTLPDHLIPHNYETSERSCSFSAFDYFCYRDVVLACNAFLSFIRY